MKQELLIDGPERVEYKMSHVIDSGLLWYVNTTCFHPHGLALTIGTDQETGVSTWALHATDGEPVVFLESDAIRKRAALDALFAEARNHGVAPKGGAPVFRKVVTA